jgi:hypothetical protein
MRVDDNLNLRAAILIHDEGGRGARVGAGAGVGPLFVRDGRDRG